MIEFWLIRHGETFDNINRTLAGHTPGKLTPLGERQALRTGEFLKTEQFDFAYVSDLGRTVQTFKNIQSQMVDQIPENRTNYTSVMREKGGGEYEGKPLELFRKTAADNKVPLRKFKGKGGECWDDVNARAQKLILTLALNHLCNPANSTKMQNSDQGEDEEVKVNHEQIGTGADTTRIMGVSHGGFIMEVHNVIEFLQNNKEPDINNVAKNCSIHKIRIQLKKENLPVDLMKISLANLSITVVEKNNNSHCSGVV